MGEKKTVSDNLGRHSNQFQGSNTLVASGCEWIGLRAMCTNLYKINGTYGTLCETYF